MSDDITPPIFWMYRIRDIDAALLYVGITCQSPPERRISQHAKTKHWWRAVADWSFECLYTYDREEAEMFEREVIILERPMWNVAHNNDRHLFRVAGHRFICTFCAAAAVVVRCERGPLGWTAMCPTCEGYYGDDSELYSVEARLIGTGPALSQMVDHLTPKSWFDYDAFMRFVVRQHLAVAA